MVPLTEREMREIAAEPMSTRERRIACTALDWLARSATLEAAAAGVAYFSGVPAGFLEAIGLPQGVAHDSDDCAPGLEVEPGRFVGGVACWDQDHDRPSPGDDITHAAFDELDRER